MNKFLPLTILLVSLLCLFIQLAMLAALLSCFGFLFFGVYLAIKKPEKRMLGLMMAGVSLIPIVVGTWWQISTYLPPIDEKIAGDFKYVGMDKDRYGIWMREANDVYEIETSKSSTRGSTGVRCIGRSKVRFILDRSHKLRNYSIFMECCSYNGKNCHYEIAYENSRKWLEDIIYTIRFDKDSNPILASHIYKIQQRREKSVTEAINNDIKMYKGEDR